MAGEDDRIKVAGYAQRVFFDNGIEYRNFSPDLVGRQLTSRGGTPLFTMGNFAVTTNIDPKSNKSFNQGTFSDFLTVDDVTEDDSTVLTIEKNVKTQLNLDITDPLQYVWYGSFVEFNRVSLEDIQSRWPAAIYVDNKVGSVTGNSVTNYSYDTLNDESTFKVNSKYFYNPFSVKYTTDSANVFETEDIDDLRNLTLNYGKYVLENGGRTYKVVDFTGSSQKTNSEITVKVKGNPFNALTNSDGSFLSSEGSFQYFIKPNQTEIELFFSSLTEYQRNILNRETFPIYKSTFRYPVNGIDGTIVYQEQTVNFPLTKDGYNLNFFDGLYLSFLDNLNTIAEMFDKNQTNLMVRKYTAEVINSFDTIPRADGDDLTNNGQKMTNVLNVYGREFDEVKKYITGIKYAHVVTYDKKNNTPDVLIKDLANMLGFEGFELLNNLDINRIFLPNEGVEGFSGQSKNYSNKEVETEVYRRIILNIAWLWKSKGTRKAVEYLFRMMGAPESVVVFDEHVYVADKPVDIEEIKRLLYIYNNGEVDISGLPFDEDGYPLPPKNTSELYFQSDGGWYRETGGDSAGIDTNIGNNPHTGPYDGGSKYMNQFQSNCFIPNFSGAPEITGMANVIYDNLFVNYNDGYFNGLTSLNNLYVVPLEGTNNQVLGNCFDIEYDIIDSLKQSGGTTTMQDEYENALVEYDNWTKAGGILEDDPYLIYSPEWYRVKRNYEIALRKYSQETNKGACYEDKCLSITLRSKNVEVASCSKFTKVESGDFIYYKDSEGKKTLFDDFPTCCVADGGVYKSFTNPTGRESCYCAKSAPCAHGNPKEITTGGIVVFEVGGVNNTNGENNTSTTTTISSPECCVWYNYSYTIDGDRNVLCVDPNYGKESLVSTDNRVQSIDDRISELEKKKSQKQNELNKLKGE
jgi:hypothetical protein